jgi:hypothetical protein
MSSQLYSRKKSWDSFLDKVKKLNAPLRELWGKRQTKGRTISTPTCASDSGRLAKLVFHPVLRLTSSSLFSENSKHSGEHSAFGCDNLGSWVSADFL